jgi:hypothetical protein
MRRHTPSYAPPTPFSHGLGRELLLTRYTQPEPELGMLLDKLKLELPAQPPPKITATEVNPPPPM